MFKIWITFGAGVAWLFSTCAGLALGEDAFVSKNRNQEIAGIKTFSGQLHVTGNLQAVSPTTTYLMTTFGDDNVSGSSSGHGLLLYTSRDGVRYTPASKTWLYEVSSHGLYPTFRDPNMLKVNDTYYCAFTAMFPYASPTYSAKFGMIRSRDLVDWTNVETPDMASQLASSTGSLYIWHSGFQQIDGTLYVLANTADNPAVNYAVPFYPSATGTDTFGAPIRITGDFPNAKCTVSGIVKIGSVYHLHGTDYGPSVGPNINVYHMTSSTPFSGYTGVSTILNNAEGAPTLVTNLDGTPYVTPEGKYRLNLHQFSPNRGVMLDTADFETYSSPVATTPTHNNASYVPGFSIANVGLTVANDFQTEQVLSALERDVLANKVGLADNNAFTGTNTFLDATGTLSGVVRMKSGASFTSPATLTFSSTTPDGTNDSQWVFTADRNYGVSFIVQNTRNDTVSPAAFNLQKPGNIWTITNTNFLLANTSGRPSLRYINQGSGAWSFIADGDTDYFGFGLGNSIRPTERVDVGGKVRAVAYKFTSGSEIYSGSGSPEGVVTASVGSLYLRVDGGTSTTLYVKQSGAGNTGWVGK